MKHAGWPQFNIESKSERENRRGAYLLSLRITNGMTVMILTWYGRMNDQSIYVDALVVLHK